MTLPVPLRAMHAAREFGRERERALEVGVQHLVPVVFGLIDGRLFHHHAGVVDQHRHRTKRRLRRIERLHDRGSIGDVHADRRRPAAFALDFLARLSSLPVWRAASTTAASCEASSRAKCRPSPCEAPVTSTTSFETSNRSAMAHTGFVPVAGTIAMPP